LEDEAAAVSAEVRLSVVAVRSELDYVSDLMLLLVCLARVGTLIQASAQDTERDTEYRCDETGHGDLLLQNEVIV